MLKKTFKTLVSVLFCLSIQVNTCVIADFLFKIAPLAWVCSLTLEQEYDSEGYVMDLENSANDSVSLYDSK